MKYSHLLFSLKTFAAACLALTISFYLDLPKPSWSLVTIYIVAQPIAGMTRSKGLYRIIGTVTGAIFAIITVPNLVNAPVLFLFVISAWIGLCLYLSMTDGTPRSYAFILAGYTAAIIGFPSVTAPEQIFDTALSRSEEIILGICCAYLSSLLPFSERAGPLLISRLKKWYQDARIWSVDVLKNKSDDEAALKDRHRLVMDSVNIDVLLHHARYDTREIRAAEGSVIKMQRLMQRQLTLLLSIQERVKFLDEKGFSERLGLQRTIVWLESGDSGLLSEIKTHVDNQIPILRAQREKEENLMAYDLMVKLKEFIANWHEMNALLKRVESGNPSDRKAFFRQGYKDRKRAFASVLTSITITMVCGMFWMLTGWPEGGTACMMAAVICSIFASFDDAATVARGFLVYTIVGTFFAAFYALLVLPSINSFPLLIIALGFFYIPAGIMMARPSLYSKVLPAVVGMSALLGIQNDYSFDFASFLNSAMAQIFGMAVAVVTLKLTRKSSARQDAENMLQSNIRDLSSMDRNFDGRIKTINERLAMMISRGSLGESELMPFLRRGLNDLQRAYDFKRLSELDASSGIKDILSVYMSRIMHGNEVELLELRKKIETAKSELYKKPSDDETTQAIVSLCNLEKGLNHA